MLSLSRAELALIGITILWGGTFLVIHTAMAYSGPLFFVGVRFLAAAVLGAVIFARHLPGLTRTELVAGSAIGSMIFAGYGLQTLGLQTITSSQSAFITALYVPMVPILQMLFLRKTPHVMSWLGVICAFGGLILLAGPADGGWQLSFGESATLIGAVAIAVEIILISRFANQVDSRRVTVVQLLVASLLAFAAMPITGEGLPVFSWVWLVAAVGLGLASVVIQLAMNWAQKSVSATRATIIYAGEPVWGGLIGRLAGDRLPGLALFGAALIVLGVLISEWRPKRQRGARTTTQGG